MIIVVTYIALRSPWQFFTLTNHGRKIMGQLRGLKGHIGMKNTGWWRDHYTLSAWEDAESMKAFARSGHHLAAMKQSAALSTRISTYSYEADKMPTWAEAKALVMQKGKWLEFPAAQ
jgi:heme-degrading monooxygenase HmoA